MKAFVTGGTGFIGSRLVSRLVERGYQVNALVRSQKGAADLQALGASTVWGDIAAVESMREGMRGCDIVFHLAAWYKLGAPDWRKAEAINMDGTRNVLGLAHQLSIPKIVYTSTVAVFGDTRGILADETYLNPGETFLTEYDRTKWLAHYKVALPMIEQGAPIIIVMPGAVYGPGDPSLVGDIMRLFYMGGLPVLPGPELTLTYAHVDDIVEGHILAAEKGKLGDSYILAGPALSMGDVVKIWAEVSHRREPFFNIPARFLKPLAPVIKAIESVMPLPPIISHDSIAILDATYIARSDKARLQLGWQTRSLVEGFQETFDAIARERHAQKAQPSPLAASRRRQFASIALGVALGLLAAWLITRRRR